MPNSAGAEGPRFLLDVNILVALAVPAHVHHVRAHEWFASIAEEWATTPMTESALLRLLTNKSIAGATMDEAVTLLRGIRAAEGHVFLPDDSSLDDAAIDITRLAGPRQVTDLHLVNLATRHGARLATLDRGISEMLEPADRQSVVVIP